MKLKKNKITKMLEEWKIQYEKDINDWDEDKIKAQLADEYAKKIKDIDKKKAEITRDYKKKTAFYENWYVKICDEIEKNHHFTIVTDNGSDTYFDTEQLFILEQVIYDVRIQYGLNKKILSRKNETQNTFFNNKNHVIVLYIENRKK